MSPPPAETAMTRLQIAAAAIALMGAVGFLVFLTQRSPDVPWIAHGHAPWIAADLPITTHAVALDTRRVPVTTFRRRFTPPAADRPLSIEISALREFELFVNGRSVGRSDGSWKRASHFEVQNDWTRVARAEIEIRVRNPSGPGLVRLSARSGAFELATDERWSAQVDGDSPGDARIASDQRRGAAGLAVPSVLDHARLRRDALVGIATICALVSWFAAPRLAPLLSGRLVPAAVLCVAAFWGWVLLAKASTLAPFYGFDGPDHLAYVRFVATRWQLPLATDGPAMYQTPLFYVLSAALASLFGVVRSGGELALRLIPFASGLVQVAVALRLARRLFPGRDGLAALAVLAAGLLPMNVYMGMYLSNEPLNAALAALALLATTEILLAPDADLRRRLALGALIGLALLAKATSLLLLPLCLGFVLIGAIALDRASPARALGHAAGALAAAAVVAGWYFARNAIELGRWVIGNWDVPGAIVTWWQHPGFHTAAYYTSFGESLRRPTFAGFHSFWDGIYSTFWGDGLIAGVASEAQRHPLWSYDFLSLVYPLALPATLVLLGGLAGLAYQALSGSDLRRRLALSFLLTTVCVYGLAVLVMTLRLPFYAQARAPYALSLVAPLALAAAFGLARLDAALAAPRWRVARTLFHAWAGTTAVCIALGFAA